MRHIFFIILLFGGVIVGQTLTKSYKMESKIKGGATKVGEYNFIEYSVKSDDGKELYQIVDKIDYDIPYSKLEVFNNGSSVLVSSFYGMLTFISNDGTKTKNIKFLDDISIEYDRNILSVVDNNNLLVVLNGHNSKHSVIKIYDKNGMIKNEYTLDITEVNAIAYSEKLNQIILSYVNWGNSGEFTKQIAILDGDNKAIKISEANFQSGFYTKENKFVGISNKKVFVLNTSNMELLHLYTVDENHIIVGITEEDGGIIVVEANNPELKNGDWHYKNPQLLRLSYDGVVLMQNHLTQELLDEYSFYMMGTTLKFNTEERSIIVE